MVADIKLTDNSIILEGAEVQNTGSTAGYAFRDRNEQGRWVWYSREGVVRLWSDKTGTDVLQIGTGQSGGGGMQIGSMQVNRLVVTGELSAHVSALEGIQVSGFGGEPHLSGLLTLADALILQPKLRVSEKFGDGLRYALLCEHEKEERDRLSINYHGHFREGVRIEGNVEVTGALTQASSVKLKEEVADLSAREAVDALNELNPVTFRYKADVQKEKRAGFIAEEAPDMLTNADRDQLSPMEIVAVLTKVVKEQQQKISELSTQITNLRG